MRVTVPVLMLALTAAATSAMAAPPAGWFLAGNDPMAYEAVLDPQETHAGAKSVRYASTREPKGFGTMMQSFDATDYRGKRLRFSAWVKAKDVQEWAGLWMRVDDASQPVKTLAFDNMQSRAIKGTSNWTRYSVVLDIAPAASGVSLGILVSGKGTVWMSQGSVDVVGNDVAVTDMYSGANTKSHKKPENLDFEH
jgi:hypothetical protein